MNKGLKHTHGVIKEGMDFHSEKVRPNEEGIVTMKPLQFYSFLFFVRK